MYSLSDSVLWWASRESTGAFSFFLFSIFLFFVFSLFRAPAQLREREKRCVCVCVVREKRSVGVGNGARWLVGQPGPTSRQLALLSYTVRSHMRIEPLSRDYSIIFEAWVCFWKSNHPIKWGTILHEDRIMPLLDSSGHYRTFEKKNIIINNTILCDPCHMLHCDHQVWSLHMKRGVCKTQLSLTR